MGVRARLERSERAGTFYIRGPRAVEVIARRVPGGLWLVPVGGEDWLLAGDDVDGMPQESLIQDARQAGEANAILFTCRECGDWLAAGDKDWGTGHGICASCESKEEC